MKRYIQFISLAIVLFSVSSLADEEPVNQPYVVSSEWGRCYAKSVPDNYDGQEGTTMVYKVTKENDELIAEHDWYSRQIYLYCNAWYTEAPEVSIVRFGPWHSGHEANENDLAIAFYADDKLLKSYSTIDIARSQKNISVSVSHYTVIEEVIGYQVIPDGWVQFVIKTYDGRELKFMAATGELIE